MSTQGHEVVPCRLENQVDRPLRAAPTWFETLGQLHQDHELALLLGWEILDGPCGTLRKEIGSDGVEFLLGDGVALVHRAARAMAVHPGFTPPRGQFQEAHQSKEDTGDCWRVPWQDRRTKKLRVIWASQLQPCGTIVVSCGNGNKRSMPLPNEAFRKMD